MKVSLEWLKELIPVPQGAEELADILTNGGIEVGSVDHLNQGLEKVVVGRLVTLVKHPDSEKLWICEVDTGHERLSIVTGAQNLKEGDKVPVALVGAELPNGVAIQASRLRGILSEGMLCSTEELLLNPSVGLERSVGGILILPEEAPIGEKLEKYLGLADVVLDLELYPNRPDCLAMVNVAREVSSLTGGKTNLPHYADLSEELGLPVVPDVNIVIEDSDLCWRYAGLVVEDAKIAPSPEWMQRRLSAAGVRPINNIVDITNYVMLEMGQPLHAFDRDQIEGAVHVRRAQPGEKLVSLDKVNRDLDPEMLLIADATQALGLAGVMGGLDSEVTAKTQRLLVESAHFSPVSIRRTSRRLGLRSEASNRFEKGVNPYGCLATLGRVAELLVQLGAGRPVGYVDQVCSLPKVGSIAISALRTSQVLGVTVTAQDIEWVLERLAFAYQSDGEEFKVEIPSYRSDLQIEEDLIEEVARLRGYAQIPTTLPEGRQTQGIRSPEQEFRRRLRQALVKAGMDEVITYSFAREASDFGWGSPETAIKLLNPLREDLSVMRTTLLPGLLEVAGRNLARRNTDLSLFEIGNIYRAKNEERPLDALPQEDLKVAGLAVGRSKRHWLSPALTYDFYYLKGVLEAAGREFGLNVEFRLPREEKLFHPGRSAEVVLSEEKVGILGELHPALEKEWGIERAVMFELDVKPLFDQAQTVPKAQAVPRFPAVQRDLALVVSKDTPVARVMEHIRDIGGELLQTVEVFDVYTGKPIPDDRRSLAFSLKYQSLERTLTDDEIIGLNGRILEGIQQEFAAEWRK